MSQEKEISDLQPAAAPIDDAARKLPAMRKAFRVTEVSGDPDPAKQSFAMRFSFPSIEALHAADDEWRKFAAPSPADERAATPAAKWRVNGEADPLGTQYDCERAALTLGTLTDDELANAVFVHDHRSLNVEAVLRGEPSSIALLTAAKERIRWLSRALEHARAASSNETAAEGATEDHECVYENGDGTCRQCAELAKLAKKRFGYVRKIDYRITGQEPDDHELCSADAPGAFPLYRSPAMAAEAVAIPAGYALVPVKITDAMIEAAMESHYGKRRVQQQGGAAAIVMTVNDHDWSGIDAMRRFWKGALAAAPQPAQADARVVLTDALIRKIATQYCEYDADGRSYNILRYEYEEDFFNCVRALLQGANHAE